MGSGVGRGNKAPRRAPGEPGPRAEVENTRLVASESGQLR